MDKSVPFEALPTTTCISSSQMSKESKKGGQFIISTVEMLLFSGANVAVFAAEVMHHHAIGIPGKCTERENKQMCERFPTDCYKHINKH